MKIAIISGSRADAGALVAVKGALDRAGALTGWFVVPEPTERQDSRWGVARATAEACNATADHLGECRPDLVIMHGDRYEILGAATAAFLMGLPVAHLGGGDVTEGSQDDSIRHSITKLSHLHFATCDESAQRLVQLGEAPDRVFNVGDPGIDIIFEGAGILQRPATLKSLGLTTDRYFLIAYHADTLLGRTKQELNILIGGIKLAQERLPNVGFVLLDPNKDSGFSMIEDEFKQLVGKNIRYCVNLPRSVYLSVLKHAVAIVGNSSAALYEAPVTGTWAINIGERQRGRDVTYNWLGTANDRGSLFDYMEKAYRRDYKVAPQSPYGDGHAAARIAKIIVNANLKDLLRKKFYNPCEGKCLTAFGKIYTLNGNGADIQRKNSLDGWPVTTTKPKTDLPSGSLILAAAQAPAPGFWPERDSQ